MKSKKPRFLFLMGGSGSGKTTLGKKLETYDPEMFYRCIEYSTREIRKDEVAGYDYNFISDERFKELDAAGELFESVKFQFPPFKYGCDFNEIKNSKVNIVVVSIEGFLSAMKSVNKKFKNCDCVLLNIINDCELDILRENRDPKAEENINIAVIKNLLKDDYDTILNESEFSGKFKKNFFYKEIKLSKLKEIRNSKEDCLEYFYGIFDKFS